MTVVGLGGVGSWAVEALARSGLGHLVLIDLDDLCLTNTNRQIHALQDTVGQAKTTALAARCRQINPGIRLTLHQEFYTEKTSERLLATPRPHVLLDAIDSTRHKCHLLAACRERGIPAITSG
ncbi:MAG: ThiF family adenylyltransferase [Cumulibacter sp.]